MTDLLETDPAAGLLSSDDEQDEVDEVEEMQVESLVSGRAKRSTAGQHMSALIDAAADDDLTLLFEEVEDDNEFDMEEAAEDEDMGLDSSSDDDDDQGPNAQNDYEGEKQLQKDERKKRRAQNDLRFQTLRKRVKIDPTVVSAIPAPPRPKKKSERISWLPTPEDGPTRSSSRRQTVNNKEMTHARLKDSQEKRERIIATMEQAAKRKAHLKPKEMTQEDHLAEAARVERTNSKTVNRWEQAERKKAEERRAKIEALQNRKLEGPVISYWSGLATWVDGRLTRVGKAEIKAKPEKEVTKKKKSEKDEKPAVSLTTPGAPSIPPVDSDAPLAPLPAPANPSTASITQSTPAPAPSEPTSLPVTSPAVPSEQQPNPPATASGSDPTSVSAPHDPPNKATSLTEATEATISTPTDQTHKPGDKASEQTTSPAHATTTTPADHQGKEDQPQVKEEDMATKEVKGPETTPSEEPSQPPRKSSQGYPLPIVEIVTNRKSATPATPASEKSGDGSQKPTTIENADRMDIDKPEVETKTDEPPTTTTATSPPQINDTLKSETQPAQIESSIASAPLLEQAGVQPGAPEATPLAPQNTQTSGTPSAGTASLPAAPPEINAIDGRPLVPGPEGPIESPAINETPTQPDAPQPPSITTQTGRTVTILENFDDRTAHSKKYSIYFNAKKPPRLAST